MTWLTRDHFAQRGAPGRFLLRRAIRIVPPYWFFTTLMIAAAVFASAYVRKTTPTVIQALTSYAFLPWPRPSDGKLNPLLSQGWTLNHEVFFYAAFALALCFRNGLRWLVVGLIILAAIHYSVPRDMFALRFWSDPIILEFVAGIGIARLYIHGVRLSVSGSLAIAGLGVAVFLAARLLPRFDDDRFLGLGPGAALLVAAFALLPEADAAGPSRRLLRLGGDASYTLYLSHTFTANAVAVLWRRQAYLSAGTGVAAAIIVATTIAIAFYRLVERPVTEALSRASGLSLPGAVQRVAP